MSSQRAAARKAAKQGQSSTGFHNPDKDNLPEERLVQVFDQVVQGVLKVPPPTATGVPEAVMEALCLQHPKFKDWAEFRALKAEEKRLQEELEYLKNKKVDPRRKGKQAQDEGSADTSAP
eukprot:TRINITY_DN15868_c0_g1_i1.p1 TRINITY_DN15868_c0_g1~~TRINITY_DN15868_c0_g1_i1.p1  ORF type:complete len:120 (+),score=31.92 TRINITY_DN15868_c0_g1_i1:73-432(+)